MSNQVYEHSSNLDKLNVVDKSIYESGIHLYNQGCGNLEDGELTNKSKCILSLTRLKQVVKKHPYLVDAQMRLAEIFYYQPSQIQWGEDSIAVRDENLKIGFKHLQKALEYDRWNSKGLQLLELYKVTHRASQTADSKAPRKEAF
tara:strand:+ start:93072 stop:93506 length:435 start_codon:yes stop_codon:yes gene_type:complete